jgi:heme exporter protein B
MGTMRDAAILAAKELRAELRTRELLATTVVFVLVVVVLFSFTFDPTSAESRRLGPGLLWLAFLFAGSLMLQPCFLKEQQNDTLSALRLAPIEPFSIFLGKLAANVVFMFLAELLLLPVFAVLYNVPVLGVLWQLLLVFLLGSMGLGALGTALSAISAHARMRELLLPLLLLPALAPVLIASTEATAGLLAETPELRQQWLGFLVAFDVVFLTATWLFGEYLLEE